MDRKDTGSFLGQAGAGMEGTSWWFAPRQVSLGRLLGPGGIPDLEGEDLALVSGTVTPHLG